MATRPFESFLFAGAMAGDYKPSHAPADVFRHGHKGLGGALPAQLVHIVKQRRVRPQRRQALEEQRLLLLAAQDVLRKVFEVAVLDDQPGRRFRADARNAREAVRRIAAS